MKKIIAASLLTSSFLLPHLAHAQISDPTKMIVEGKVDLRRGADTAYSIVSTLNEGQEVTVIDEFTNSSGQKWYRVDLGSILGWGPASLFMANNEIGIVTADTLNIRRGASSSYQIVGKVVYGTKVNVLDTFVNTSGETWYRITYGSTTGWVLGDFLKTSFTKSTTPETDSEPNPVTVKTVLAESTEIRRGADDSYFAVSILTQNQQVTILDTFTNQKGQLWYRVQFGNTIGWVISTAFDEPAPPEPQLPETKTVLVEQADIRRGATDSYSVIATLVKNQEVNILDSFTNQAGQLWYRVQYENTIGWVISTAFEVLPQLPETKTVLVDKTSIRRGATDSYSAVATLVKNQEVTILDSFTNQAGELWYRVQYGNVIGWVISTAFEVPPQLPETKTVLADKTYIRRGATNSYSAVATLVKNQEVTILDSFTNQAGELWYRVQYENTIGWVISTAFELQDGLFAPSIHTNGNEGYLDWRKASDYQVSYSISENQLKITVGTPDISLPSSNLPGIKSVMTQTSGASTSIMVTFNPGYTFTLRDYEDKLSLKVLPTGLLGKKIIIDAGHGGQDGGAIGPNGIQEKDVNLAEALVLKTVLEKAGAYVTLTRSTDVFLELSERTDIANQSNADAFISIHCDSFSSTSRGTTTYYNTTENFNAPKSEILAGFVQQNTVQAISTYNRGMKEEEFYVNRMNELPSILVELAFISNPTEEAMLASPEFQQNAALGIKNGLEQYFSNF